VESSLIPELKPSKMAQGFPMRDRRKKRELAKVFDLRKIFIKLDIALKQL